MLRKINLDSLSMAGNEIEVCKFLFSNLGVIFLEHIGRVIEISAPMGVGGYRGITTSNDLQLISTSSARKKADVYLNGRGISIKQLGPSVLFNRLQRVNLYNLLSGLNISDIEAKINQLDLEIRQFHNGYILRDRPWQNFFEEQDFKKLVNFLMLKGSPNYGLSMHPVDYILEAPNRIEKPSDIKIYSFDEFFQHYYTAIRISIRRSWIGQLSNSEHNRALSLSRKQGNLPWVYDNIITEPPTGWRENFPESAKKTVYYIMILKVK